MSPRERMSRLLEGLPPSLRPSRALDRHVAPVLTAVFLGVLLSTVAAYFYSKGTLEDLARSQAVQTMGYLDREISSRVQGVAFNAGAWAKEEVYRLALEDSYLGLSARAGAERKLATLGAYSFSDRIFLANAAGEVVAASQPDMTGTFTVGDRDYFHRAMAGQQVLETLRSGRYNGQPVLLVASPLADQDSTVQGVLVAALDIARFTGALLVDARLGRSGDSYILDAEGAILSAPTWGRAEDLPPEAVVREILKSAEEGRPVHYSRAGAARLAISRRNQATGWTVVVEADEAEVLRPARRQATIGGAISFATLALVAMALGALRRTLGSLQKSEERSRAITGLSPVGILTCLSTGALAYANGHARQVLGLGPDEPLPNFLVLQNEYGQPLPPEANPVLRALGRGESVGATPAWHELPGGERRVLSVSAAPLAGEGAVIALEDVTERRRTLDALMAEKRFTEALLDGLPGIFYVYDKDLRLVRWNRNHETLTGYGPEEMRGRFVGDWHATDELAQLAVEAARRVLYQGVHAQVEGVLRHKDGHALPFLLTGVRLETADGPMLMGVGFDISQRLAAEEGLRASEEKYRAIFNNAPVGIFRTSVQGRFLEANPTLASMLGYESREELLERVTNLAMDIYPSPAERQRLLDGLARNPDGVRMEIEFRRLDGTPFFAIINASLQMDTAGRPTFIDGTIEDITQRKQAEERLRQSEHKFSQLFRLSPDGINLVDPATNVIVDANDSFLEHLGRTREEVVGKTRAEIGLVHEAGVEAEIARRLAEEGAVRNVEVPSRGADGSAIVSLSLQMVEIDGKEFILCISRDVSDIKRMQEVMVQTEKMISVGGIAAGIAHEINNPLGIVLQGAQTLAQRLNPEFRKNREAAERLGLDPALLTGYLQARDIGTFIEDIQSAAMRASAIIRHMLDFSRKSESRRSVCDLAVITDKAVNLAKSDYDLKKNYDFKKIDIVREFEPDLPPLPCTETEIEQVLLNLLRNAAQAMFTSPRVGEQPRIVLRLGRCPGGLRLEVEDNGPGMSPDVRRRIFEPFFTTKAPGVGTGLGLSVSYFIITKGHGGAMDVESSPDWGTRFRIELPLGGEAR